MAVRVGIDLVSVESVARSLDGPLRGRYLARIYTRAEVAACTTPRGVDPAMLAARFAAKEAALKVIAAGDQGISFRDIEVLGRRARNPRLALHGRAAQLAADAGLTGLSLSVTHDDILAAAFVVAQCR